MPFIQKVLKYAKKPSLIIVSMINKGYFNWLDDRHYLQLAYRAKLGKKLDLKNPTTYTEKLQWLKLYDRRDEYTRMVDKYEAKKYIAERIGEEYIIPTLGIYDSFDEIDFDSLPDQFVLKCTHNSGGLVICKDKSKLDIAAAKDKIEKSLRRNYYLLGREWPYKNVKPRIIAEQYMEDEKTAELRDYKFFSFDGEPKLMMLATERQLAAEPKFNFFDMEGAHLPLTCAHPNAKITPSLPVNFLRMQDLTRQLSAGFPHLRVDFYEVNAKIFIGELTFFFMGGMSPFEPEEWNERIGSWITLPDKKK